MTKWHEKWYNLTGLFYKNQFFLKRTFEMHGDSLLLQNEGYKKREREEVKREKKDEFKANS
ncbi:MAG: hypothetical protein SO147_09055 [Clostridia bacterium]|nr:hypothetical protein [Clostridia bacterium]